MFGHVYTIRLDIQPGVCMTQGHDVLALVDADGSYCQPHESILTTAKLRILLTSSPRTKRGRGWLTQNVHDEHASYIVGPWEWKEIAIALFVTSF
jgi:hypothetical protein